MEAFKRMMYKVLGNNDFRSNTYYSKTEAENVANKVKGFVVEIIK